MAGATHGRSLHEGPGRPVLRVVSMGHRRRGTGSGQAWHGSLGHVDPCGDHCTRGCRVCAAVSVRRAATVAPGVHGAQAAGAGEREGQSRHEWLRGSSYRQQARQSPVTRGRPGQLVETVKEEDARYQAGVGHHRGTPHTTSQTGPHGTPPDGRTTRRPTGENRPTERGPARPHAGTPKDWTAKPRQEPPRSRPIFRHRAVLRRESAPMPRRYWLFLPGESRAMPPFAAEYPPTARYPAAYPVSRLPKPIHRPDPLSFAAG